MRVLGCGTGGKFDPNTVCKGGTEVKFVVPKWIALDTIDSKIDSLSIIESWNCDWKITEEHFTYGKIA